MDAQVDDMKLVQTCARRRGSSGGFLIALVLALALVGFLFGVGRLLAYRFQCERRLDRQDELNRIMATRSAMQALAQPGVDLLCLPNVTTSFVYTTRTGADRVSIVPTGPIWLFDFVSNAVPLNWANVTAYSSATLVPVMTPEDGLVIDATTNAPIGERYGVGVNLTNTWLSDTYGRRYWMKPKEQMPSSNNVSDTVRFGLVARTSAVDVAIGIADMESSPAILFKQQQTSAGHVTITLYWQDGHGQSSNLFTVVKDTVADELVWQPLYGRGIQLAGTKVTLFACGNNQGFVLAEPTYDLPPWVTNTFLKARMYLEVERQIIVPPLVDARDKFWHLRVDPAYEFSCSLSWSSHRSHALMSETSTVMRVDTRKGETPSSGFPVVTYDTHGTTAK